MRLDKYSNPIFSEQDLFDALYTGHRISVGDIVLVEERTADICNLENTLEFKFLEPYETYFEVDDYDKACQSIWNMPDEYKTLDIEQWIREQGPPWDPNFTRIEEELAAYKARDMLDLLRWLKYFVDTCSKEQVLWGLGRGSSVASYVLYLIGVHNIDPIKYNLDWQEFLR
jgi:DNA polymerase III alpha subunit